MSKKRFTDINIWDQDWFIELPVEYKLFWFYLKDNCDHAGFFKVNLTPFCRLNEVKIESNKALEYYNLDKQRIRVIKDNLWYLEDFFVFQYGPTLNEKSRVHESILKLYNLHEVAVESIRGLKDFIERVKDKDKEEDKGNLLPKLINVSEEENKISNTSSNTLSNNKESSSPSEDKYANVDPVDMWNDFVVKVLKNENKKIVMLSPLAMEGIDFIKNNKKKSFHEFLVYLQKNKWLITRSWFHFDWLYVDDPMHNKLVGIFNSRYKDKFFDHKKVG